ncbi:2-succinyl-6-hydroxy-2,4-cyclohexadiene-1-carboxylate synthase [Psychrobacillus sp. OK028]|uniref:2-succinyl-6-hydroxy-2, 4-cyclohexadiene-1-carboxylate synthase n=1 Tax=Psychrobacillus sp. OK028 TaxID=1884359 RepID=UPI00087ED1B3|nr:2-succinyl-6-hydroxy-2,4-cyclohexadiene-1-carboxylate synthase [Psychrobacillus sp. OK028]SDM69426.1 2-succinyl-6-hydroxy-2,4-cyclohexadiene-1-carboxylate synthase [Psychrobacillus sp. OK028]
MESITVNIRGIDIHFNRYNNGAVDKIVFLHGFTGSTHTWNEVISNLPNTFDILSIDLIGHGETSKPINPGRYVVEEQIADLHALFQQLQWSNFTLVGYSMGGRLALAYASKYPVKRLILESSSPGLSDEEERLNRKQSDEQLAHRILNDGLTLFVDFWESIPLFHSQQNLSLEKQVLIRQERLAGSEIGLANSLRGFSTGVQPSYWDKLEEIIIPTILITGELDEKFCKLAEAMKKYLPNVAHKEINDVGHAIHVENPELFATIVEDIILKEDVR